MMGKVLQPQNALPARPSSGGPANGAEPATAEALGRQLRAALPPIRLHSISIYDGQGNVLWLSEGALGPDEHSLVLEALETLNGDNGRGYCEHGLENGRIAAFLAVRAPQGHLVGLAMILADIKSSGEGLMDRIMSAPTRTDPAEARGAPAARRIHERGPRSSPQPLLQPLGWNPSRRPRCRYRLWPAPRARRRAAGRTSSRRMR